MLIVILGMHRSGTSCLARMLQRGGMYLGGDPGAAASSNPAGHAEAWEAVRINDRLLELSGGAWDRAPRRLAGDADTAARMAAFVAELRAEPVAGWKDPRTTLTFPLWRPHLADFRVAACLRHPLAVAHSLRVRDGWPQARGLRLWAAYNERLLEYTAGLPGVFWFDFDLAPDDLRASVRAFGRQVGLAGDPGGAFNRFLRHHQDADTPTDPTVRSLYERLKARAQDQDRERLRPARPSGDDCAACRELRSCLEELASVLRTQGEVQQCQTRWQDNFRLRQAELEELLQSTRNNVETLAHNPSSKHPREHGPALAVLLSSPTRLERRLRRLSRAADRLSRQQRQLAGALPVLTAAVERLTADFEARTAWWRAPATA
jgi:hypothetical protein